MGPRLSQMHGLQQGGFEKRVVTLSKWNLERQTDSQFHMISKIAIPLKKHWLKYKNEIENLSGYDRKKRIKDY